MEWSAAPRWPDPGARPDGSLADFLGRSRRPIGRTADHRPGTRPPVPLGRRPEDDVTPRLTGS